MKNCLYITMCLVLFSCSDAETSSNTLTEEEPTGFVPDPDFDFENCPTTWDIDEAILYPDKYCGLSLNTSEKKYTKIPSCTEDMHYIRRLDMSGHEISEIPEHLKDLEDLNLTLNKLTSCPKGLENLRGLINLNLSANDIETLIPEIFEMELLETFHFSENELSEFPEGFTKLTNLKTLNLAHNELSSVPSSISKMSNLEQLFLSNQKNLRSLPEEFGQLKNLKSLWVGGNSFETKNDSGQTTLPACIFELSSLVYLDAENSELEVISEDISNLNKLETLNLSGNYLNTLPIEISDLPNLRTLYVYDNNFSEEMQDSIQVWFHEEVEVLFYEEYGD